MAEVGTSGPTEQSVLAALPSNPNQVHAVPHTLYCNGVLLAYVIGPASQRGCNPHPNRVGKNLGFTGFAQPNAQCPTSDIEQVLPLNKLSGCKLVSDVWVDSVVCWLWVNKHSNYIYSLDVLVNVTLAKCPSH